MRKQLVPEPAILITAEPWVWKDYYQMDPEESGVISIALPEAGPLSGPSQGLRTLVDSKAGSSLREKAKKLVESQNHERASAEFRQALSALGLHRQGFYRLTPPPIQAESSMPGFDPREREPLLLVSSNLNG